MCVREDKHRLVNLMSTITYPTEDSIVTVTTTVKSWTATNCTETGTLSTSTQTSCSSRRTRTAVGYRIPGWRKLKNSGAILPMTPWVQTELDLRANPAERGWCSSSNRRTKYENYYTSLGQNILTGGIQNANVSHFMSRIQPYDLQYYVQKAAAGIYSSGWDAATFLAEIGQLRRMLSGVGRKLDNLSQGRKPGELYDLWLEGRYGWRTLMYDIRDLHQVLSSANERRTRYRETKGFTDSGTYDENFVTGSNPSTRWQNNLSWTINMRGTVVADIEVPDFQFNPVTTAWEVTRLSFVVDWLLNVGQALEAASFLLAAKAYKACGGVKVDFNLSGTSSLESKGTLTSAYHSGTWGGSASYVERSPMSVSAIPRIKLRLDEYKVIDLLALVRQRLR